MGVLRADFICVCFVLYHGLIDHEVLAAKEIERCKDHIVQTVQHPFISPAVLVTSAKPILRTVSLPMATGKPILVPIKSTHNGYQLILNPNKNCSITVEHVNPQHVSVKGGDKPDHDITQTETDENKTHINKNMVEMTTRPVIYRGKPLACALFYDDTKVHNISSTVPQVHGLSDKSTCEDKVLSQEHNSNNPDTAHVTQPIHDDIHCVTPKSADIVITNATSICTIDFTNNTDHGKEEKVMTTIQSGSSKLPAKKMNKTIVEHVTDCNGNTHEVEHQVPVTPSSNKEHLPAHIQSNTTRCVTEHIVPDVANLTSTNAPVTKATTLNSIIPTTTPTNCKKELKIVDKSSNLTCINRTESHLEFESNKTDSNINLLSDNVQLIGTIDIAPNNTITIENETVEEVEEFNKKPGDVYENMQLVWYPQGWRGTGISQNKMMSNNIPAQCQRYRYNANSNNNQYSNNNAVNYSGNQNSNYNYNNNQNSNINYNDNQYSDNNYKKTSNFNYMTNPYIIVPSQNSNGMNKDCNSNFNQKPNYNKFTTKQVIPLQCSQNKLMLPGSYTVSTTGDKLKDRVHRLWKNTQIRICNTNKNSTPFKIILSSKANVKTSTERPVVDHGCYKNQNSQSKAILI